MRGKRSLIVPVALALAVALLPPGHLARASVFTVTNLADSGSGSLRQAIIDANNHSGPDTIDFNITGCTDSLCIIQPLSALPPLTDAGTIIDGTTQLGATVVVNGEQAGFCSGFQIVSSDSAIKGLWIEEFEGNGIEIDGIDLTGNTVSGNYIVDNDMHGVFVGGGQGHTIGGDTSAERNLISGSGWSGIFVTGPGPAGSTVSGNDITYSGQYGVHIVDGAQNNTIGGDTAAERNLIMGNELSGILISGTDSMSNTVRGNYIGTDGTGYKGNVQSGVCIASAPNNTIGPDNVISGNKLHGVFISGCSASGNTVSGNYIGTDASGTASVGNFYNGIKIADGAQDNTVGPDNVISGNVWSGVLIGGSGTMSNTVSGNCIGTKASCTRDLGNGWAGVNIELHAHNNTVGPGNVIAHSGYYGVGVFGSGSTGNTITQNSIHKIGRAHV